ncbi:hypothetical protein [Paenibacillus cymbidii]|uniref:hypothetical protein n=1 Tax=Paenibacillus cymbidii TaxID=1639034 RepID=UPI001080573D|nr:hypothetical protein [Paenibacillus cymbidii]
MTEEYKIAYGANIESIRARSLHHSLAIASNNGDPEKIKEIIAALFINNVEEAKRDTPVKKTETSKDAGPEPFKPSNQPAKKPLQVSLTKKTVVKPTIQPKKPNNIAAANANSKPKSMPEPFKHLKYAKSVNRPNRKPFEHIQGSK